MPRQASLCNLCELMTWHIYLLTVTTLLPSPKKFKTPPTRLVKLTKKLHRFQIFTSCVKLLSDSESLFLSNFKFCFYRAFHTNVRSQIPKNSFEFERHLFSVQTKPRINWEVRTAGASARFSSSQSHSALPFAANNLRGLFSFSIFFNFYFLIRIFL